MALAAALAGGTATAASPLRGAPTARMHAATGTGSFGGVAFRGLSAVASWNPETRSLTLSVFDRPHVGCATLGRTMAIRPGRSIHVVVARVPAKLLRGATIRDPFVRFAHRIDRSNVETQLVQHGVRLRLTDLGRSVGGRWRGRLDVASRRVDGRTYSYAGTFVAPSCRL